MVVVEVGSVIIFRVQLNFNNANAFEGCILSNQNLLYNVALMSRNMGKYIY